MNNIIITKHICCVVCVCKLKKEQLCFVLTNGDCAHTHTNIKN